MKEIAASVVVLSGALVWLGNLFCRDSGNGVYIVGGAALCVAGVTLLAMFGTTKRRTTSGPPNRRHGAEVLKAVRIWLTPTRWPD